MRRKHLVLGGSAIGLAALALACVWACGQRGREERPETSARNIRGDWKPAAALREQPAAESLQVKVDESDAGTIELVYDIPPLSVERVPVESLLPARDDSGKVLCADGARSREEIERELAELAGGRRVVRVALGNAPSAGAAGEPVLPVVPSKTIIPAGRELEGVEVTYGRKVTLGGSYFVVSGQNPMAILPGARAEYTPPDPRIYGSDEAWPGRLVDAANVQRRRGVAYALTNLNPIEYQPKSGKLSYYESMSLRITTRPAATAGGTRYRPDPVRPLAEGAENPDELAGYDALPGPGAGEAAPLASYQYVVVTSQAIRDAATTPNLNDLLARKQASGLTTKVVTIESILADYAGVDGAEKLRNFIKYAYNNWGTDFVLLAGDTGIVPMRKLTTNGEAIPSDLYYQCLDGSYNNDGDGVWGETTDGVGGGDVDLLSEVYVGRASAENAAEFSNFVYKTLAYENDAEASDYLRRALIAGEFLGANFGPGIFGYAVPYMEEIRLGASTSGYSTAGFAACPSISVERFYDYPAGWEGNASAYAWTKAGMLAKLNSGAYGMINHLGHANYNYVMRFYNADADALTNDRFFFLISQGCIPGNFETDCMAEHLTTSTRHGAFAAVLNSRYGWGAYNTAVATMDGPSQRLQRQFWDAYFAESVFNLGALNADSHEDNIWCINAGYIRWCVYESNLFGDPQTVLRGRSVTPVLAFASKAASDAAPGGNGDGIANPGEAVSLAVTLRNVGLDTAAGVNATLTTADAHVTVTDGSAAFGSVPGGGAQKAALDPFAISIAADCPTPHDVTFNLNITAAGSGPWTEGFSLTVYTSSRVSGKVVRAGSGVGIDGATVAYSGPMSGTATAGADGSYAFAGIDGTYTLVASASGCLDSEPREVTVPPDQSDVDFALGMADIDTAPAALEIEAEEGVSGTVPLTIRNLGDATLTWSATAAGTAWQATGFWHETTHRTCGGAKSWYYGIEDQWSYSNGAANSGSLTSGSIPLPGGAVSLTFRQWRQTEGGNSYDKSLVQISTDGGATWTQVHQSLDNTAAWAEASVNLSAYAGQTVKLRFVFDTVDDFDNDYEGWYIDDLRINGAPLGWLSTEPLSGSLAAGAEQVVSVKGDAACLTAGVYAATLAISSNDAGEPTVAIPVTFTVTTAPCMTYASQSLNDGDAAPSAGDGDGAAEPGETVELTVSIRNSGHGGASGLSGVLTTADGLATVTSAASEFPDAAVGAAVAGSTPFVVELSADCPNDHEVAMNLAVSDGAGRHWDVPVTLAVSWRSRLTGVVTAMGGGAPISWATVSVTGGFAAPSGPDGSYTISGIPAGTRTVTVSKNGYVAASASLTFPPDRTRDFQLGFPGIAVSPASLIKTVQAGQAGTGTLTIGSPGSLPLTWSVSTGMEGFTMSHSDQAGGPAYSWTEISATGTQIAGLGDESNVGPIAIGFSFPFYGQNFTSFRVNSNGWLSFTSTKATSYTNCALPSAAATTPENLVAFFWDDLDFSCGGSAWYKLLDADTLAVEFKDVCFYNDESKKLTCQAVLRSDGTILFLYQAVGIANSCTVGLQNADKTKGVQAVCNSALIHAGMAVQFAPSAGWLTLSPASGTTGPGGSSAVTATFNAAALAEGVYSATVRVTSNDLETPTVDVPVTLTVEPPPNTPPEVSSFSPATPFAMSEGQVQVFSVEAWDADGHALSHAWTLDGAPVGGNRDFCSYAPGFTDAGNHTLTVTISDGHAGTAVQTWEIAVADVPRPPTASLTSPAAGTIYAAPASISIAASASDPDGTVTRVEFYSGSTLLATDEAAPYACTWNGVDIGSRTLTAKAYDNSGLCTVSAPVTIKVRPKVTLAVSDAWASEPSSNKGRFKIARTGSTAASLTVRYSMSGTATNGTDYVTLGGSATIPAGSSYVYVYVAPRDDTRREGIETAVMTLSARSSYVLGSPVKGTVKFLDNEMPVVSVSAYDASAAEPTNTGRFKVQRTGSTAAKLVVYYSMGGTALNGTDYRKLPGTVTIPAGKRYVYVTLTPVNDSLKEGAEYAKLKLKANTKYQLSTGTSATVNLADND